MATVEIGRFEDTLVLHFKTESHSINAYTLATALISLADAAKAANAALNPGYEIEIVVETLGAGSVRATVRTIYREARNLFSVDTARAIVIGVLTAFIYQHTLAPDIEVRIEPGAVVIEQGDTRIVVPRDVYEGVQEVEQSVTFRNGIARAIRAIEADPSISALALSPTQDDPEGFAPEIPKARLALLPKLLDPAEDGERDLVEITDVQILRAILQRSRRRWEFSWNGIRIAAPVLDQQFYDDFFAHRITIAPGDALRVRLRIRQRRSADMGIFINEAYEIVDVLEHIPRQAQPRLEDR